VNRRDETCAPSNAAIQGERSTVSTPPESRYRLQLYLLGPPQVEAQGHALDIARRQVRALLYRLAAELEPIPREQLCFLFWPDARESGARRNLTHLLTHMRSILPAPDLLSTPGDLVALDADRVWSDSAALLRFGARRSPPSSAAGELPALADAYRGPFLSGFSLPDSAEFELWVVQQQRSCERAYLRLLNLLVERAGADGDIDAAIAWSQRQLATDPLAEEVHRRLIGLYAAAGRRADALRQYEQCAIALERELGVPPLPETRAAYAAALRDERAPPPADPTPVVRPPLPLPDPPLVGRAAALHGLERAYAVCRAGQGGFVLISGEAGVGKSRLMAAFAQEIAEEAIVVTAGGQVGAERLPYRPVIEVLRRLMDDTPHGGASGGIPLFNGLDEAWVAELSRLLPELRTQRLHLPLPLQSGPAEARTRLIEAACRAVTTVADGDRPVVLCLDDLQWTDAATLDWLLCLAERLVHHRCLVLTTYRTEESKLLDAFLDALARRIRFGMLDLHGLEQEAIADLIHHVTQSLPEGAPSLGGYQALAARLSAVTGGNPFFALEILRTLAESDQLHGDLTSLTQLPLPDTVRQAVRARLRPLSPPTAQLLESGAVLGSPFEPEALALTAGRDELETVNGLDELTGRQILIHDAETETFSFHHEIVRQVVELRLSPVRRQLLHRRAGRALSQLGAASPVSLAEHHDMGNEPEQALYYYAKAVKEAETVFAWQTVEQLQARMLSLLDRLDPEQNHPERLARRGEILASRAHLYFLQGRLTARDDDLARLADLARITADRHLQLQALVQQVRYLNLDAHYPDALNAARAGLSLADALGDAAARSRLLAQVGFAHYFLGEPQPALSALNAALTTVGGTDDPALRGRVLHILGYVHFHLGDYARALTYQREAQACHRTEGDLNRVAWDGLDIGAALLELGAGNEGEAEIKEHLALARRIGSRPAEAYGLTLLGCAALHGGIYVTAIAHFREAEILQQDLHSDHGTVAARLGAGLALSRLGDLTVARQELTRAAHQARTIAHRRRLGEVLLARGLLEHAAGRLQDAESALAEALALAQASECWETATVARTVLAALARQQGSPARALDYAQDAIAYADARRLPGPGAWAESELGLALLAQSDAPAALEHTSRAVAGLSHLHEAWIGHEALHLAHERALRALGEDAAADAQRALAEACLARKAAHIADPELRRRYLAFARSSLAA
jgi:DNA-binding SARP family transcriptional activator